MALTQKHVENICMWGCGAHQCRFLAEDDTATKFYCLKLVAQQKPRIDGVVSDFIKKHKARGIDPHTMGLPLADNCKGYRYLTEKMQGYDLDTKP